jgi:hypothetical protein
MDHNRDATPMVAIMCFLAQDLPKEKHSAQPVFQTFICVISYA